MATVPDELADIDFAKTDEPAVADSLSVPLPVPLSSRPPVAPLVRFSVADVELMIASGVFADGRRCELIDGLIVERGMKGLTHENIAEAIADFLHELKTVDKQKHGRDRCRVRTESPLSLPAQASMPEPDIMLLAGDRDRYADQRPEAADTLLVIEVADTTLAKDKRVAGIYAAAGVPRYLLVDVNARTLTLHEQPSADGYGEVRQMDTVPVVVGDDVLGELTAATVFGESPTSEATEGPSA